MKSLIFAAIMAASMASTALAESSAHTNWGLKTGTGGGAPVDRMHVLGDYAGKVNDGAGLTGTVYSTTIYQDVCAVCITVETNGDGNDTEINVDQDGDTTGDQRVNRVR